MKKSEAMWEVLGSNPNQWQTLINWNWNWITTWLKWNDCEIYMHDRDDIAAQEFNVQTNENKQWQPSSCGHSVNESINQSTHQSNQWVEMQVNKYTTATMKGWPDSFKPVPSEGRIWHLHGEGRPRNNHAYGCFRPQHLTLTMLHFLSQFLNWEQWEEWLMGLDESSHGYRVSIVGLDHDLQSLYLFLPIFSWSLTTQCSSAPESRGIPFRSHSKPWSRELQRQLEETVTNANTRPKSGGSSSGNPEE